MHRNLTLEDFTPAQVALLSDIAKSEDGHVLLHDYHRSTVDALLRKGIITILMHRKHGRREGRVIRIRKGHECQNANLR